MKKFLSVLVAAMLVLAMGVVALADDDTTLPTAVDGVITLQNDVTLSSCVALGSDVIIDLNGHKITGPSDDYIFSISSNITVEVKNGEIEGYQGFKCFDGSLTLTNVKVTTTGRSVACYDAAVVTVGAGSTLTTTGEDAGIVVWGDAANSKTPTLNVYGTVIAGTGERSEDKRYATISTNGMDYSNPVINVYDGAVITSGDSAAMYIPVCGSVNIYGGTITGYSSAVAIKEGELNISGGKLVCNGPDTTPTNGYSNGINASGAAIQIESNSAYKEDADTPGTVVVNITGGEIISENGSPIYEYIDNQTNADGTSKTTNTHLDELNISGGTVTGANEKVLFVSEEVANSGADIITVSGGDFSSEVPDAYVDDDKVNVSITSSGETRYYIGQSAESAVSNASSGDVVTVISAPAGTELNAGSGAEIVNNSGSTITVNGKTVATGVSFTVPAPAKTPVRDTVTIEVGGEKTESEDKAEENPNTGAPAFMGAAAFLAAVSLGCAALSKKK